MGQNLLMHPRGGQLEPWEPPYTYVWGDSSTDITNGNQHYINNNLTNVPVPHDLHGMSHACNRNFAGINGVAMATVQPRNSSEWQLYRVLQRANLLQYYDTFIAQGGDDVQQLCEAGEDEFLEIMALVGMASKPLHVRRLQKALQEWVSNPAAFQGAISATSMSSLLSTVAAASSQGVALGGITLTPTMDKNLAFTSQHSTSVSNPVWAAASQQPQTTQPQAVATTPKQAMPQIQQTPPSGIITVSTATSQQSIVPPSNISPVPHSNTPGSSSGSSIQGELKIDFSGTPLDKPHSSTSPVPTPVLVESQINAIAEAAATLSAELPPFEPKRLNMKKQINRDIMNVMQMSDDDANRMEELRKYAAIYGRFDSKRKGEKPMSLHEISVNEAAAQLCRHRVALLTRREDLFPLARQIVKNSGYQYSKGHSRASEMIVPPMSASKRLRFDPFFLMMCESSPRLAKQEMDRLQREERMTTVVQELLLITQRQEDLKAQLQNAKDNGNTDMDLVKSLQTELDQITAQQHQLRTEQNEIFQKQRRAEKRKADDTDDLASGSSSPGADNSGDGDEFALLRSQFYANKVASNLAKGTLMQDTLFDEGLRIAQQYGMADFAQELKQMHQVTEGDGDSAQQEDDSGENEIAATFPMNNGNNGLAEPKENGDSAHDSSENITQKVQPITLAAINGTDFMVKTEPEETVNER